MYVAMYRRRLIIGIDLCSYGAEKSHSLPSANCKTIGVIQSEAGGTRIREADLSPKAWEPGTLKYSFLFCFLKFSGLDNAHSLTLGKAISFSQFTNSTANLFQRHPSRHTQKSSFTRPLGILFLSPAKLIHKVNHHRPSWVCTRNAKLV